MLMRLMDLPGWMPKPIESLIPHHGDALAAGQATIGNILRVMDDHVVFSCLLNGRPFYFDLNVPDRKTSEKVAEILRSSRGKSMISISTIKLPADKKAA
jgi:hypothetical protein